jgi:hypothetical protein
MCYIQLVGSLVNDDVETGQEQQQKTGSKRTLGPSKRDEESEISRRAQS